MDPKDLEATLAELQGKASAKKKENEPVDLHRDLLEKLLGQKVRFDGDPYVGRSGGGTGTARDVSCVSRISYLELADSRLT